MTQDIYAAEAKERWGDTDAYKESQRRLAGYSKEDIAKAQQAMQDATNLILEAMKAGDRKSTRLNSSHSQQSRMPSSA